MPALIALVWTAAHPVVPYVWNCSECGAVFDVGPLRYTKLTKEQIGQVNNQFEVHCQQAPPGLLQVIGLGADG
jgi:hypothetical protein